MGISIAPRGKQWAVHKSGSDRAWVIKRTQAQAVAFASGRGEWIYIHTPNGLIAERISPKDQGATYERPQDVRRGVRPTLTIKKPSAPPNPFTKWPLAEGE